MMKSTFLATLLIVGTNVLLAQEFHPDQGLIALSGEEKNIGIAAACTINGAIHWTKSAGLSCQDGDLPFSPKTLTRIASIAKVFTAVAIMQLAEQGRIDLGAPIETYLADLPPDKTQITALQLLAHTSGINQYEGEKEIENTVHYASLQDAMNVFIHRPLLFEPGDKFFYTTYGYVVLGRIIEATTSMTYEAYMRKHIFDVAEMQDTHIEDINIEYPNTSCRYHYNGRKAREGRQNDLSNRIPGGGYISTLEDILKFVNALLDGKLISQESLDKMLEAQPVAYDGNKYGLGWCLYGPPPYENLVIGHGGTQTGCTSQLMIIPRTKTAVVVLTNTSGNYPDIATFASKLVGYSEEKK